MKPLEKRKLAMEYAKDQVAKNLICEDLIVVADHYLSGLNDGYKIAREESALHRANRMRRLEQKQGELK